MKLLPIQSSRKNPLCIGIGEAVCVICLTTTYDRKYAAKYTNISITIFFNTMTEILSPKEILKKFSFFRRRLSYSVKEPSTSIVMIQTNASWHCIR